MVPVSKLVRRVKGKTVGSALTAAALEFGTTAIAHRDAQMAKLQETVFVVTRAAQANTGLAQNARIRALPRRID